VRSMRECLENVLLQSAKRLWMRASLRENNNQDYFNTALASNDPRSSRRKPQIIFSFCFLADGGACSAASYAQTITSHALMRINCHDANTSSPSPPEFIIGPGFRTRWRGQAPAGTHTPQQYRETAEYGSRASLTLARDDSGTIVLSSAKWPHINTSSPRRRGPILRSHRSAEREDTGVCFFDLASLIDAWLAFF